MGKALILFPGNQHDWVPIWSACTLMENQQEELEVWMQLQGYNISFASQSCSGIAHTTGPVQWMDTSDLPRTGWEGREELPFLWESSKDVWSSASGKVWARWQLMGQDNILLKWSINKLGSNLYMLPMRKSCSWRSFIVQKRRALMLTQDVQSGVCDLSQCNSWTTPFAACLSQGIYNFQLVMFVLDLNGYSLSWKCSWDAPHLKLVHWFLGPLKLFGRLLRFNNVIYGNHKISTSTDWRFCKRLPFCLLSLCTDFVWVSSSLHIAHKTSS